MRLHPLPICPALHLRHSFEIGQIPLHGLADATVECFQGPPSDAASQSMTKLLPMKPAPPVTKIDMLLPFCKAATLLVFRKQMWQLCVIELLVE